MCPACISTATLALVGATSTGGLFALLTTLFGGRKGPKRARRETENGEDTAACASGAPLEVTPCR